jgi:CxxC motif-containing protein
MFFVNRNYQSLKNNLNVCPVFGDLIYSSLINNPQTYITTVGLYNDNNDLLAVAKLSKPLPKDFTKECLIRMKLDF